MITLPQNNSQVKHSSCPSANEGFFLDLDYRRRLQKYLQWAKAPLNSPFKVNSLIGAIGS
jgi:hypothetical protein